MTTVVNIKQSDFDIYIGRGKCPKTNELSEWGNPYTHIKDGITLAAYIVPSRKDAIEKHYWYLKNKLDTDKFLLERFKLLSGKKLGCFCKPKSCHGDNIIRLLDEFFPQDNLW